jgi:predicted kinase
MPTAYLIHGYLGAGKTTFAKKLEADGLGIRWSVDERMTARYGDDPPAEKFEQIYNEAQDEVDLEWHKALGQGKDVILDCGFWRRDFRDRVRREVAQLGGQVKLYALSTSEETARKRCVLRNKNLQGSLRVTEDTYEVLKSRFEALAEDEPCQRVET